MSLRTMSNKKSIVLKDIIEEIKKNEGDACITIVLSGKLKSFDDKEKAQVQIRKIISTTQKVLIAEYGKEASVSLIKELSAVFLNLDFGNARETLVVYVSNGFGKSLWLPFAEKERLTIRNTFDLQPLTNAINKERDYWVLALSKNKTRLFRGTNDLIVEINDHSFPLAYEEQFQFEKPRFAQSNRKGTYSPRDSRVDAERLHAFFRHIDHLLKPFFKKENLPIILLGVEHNLSDFAKTSSFSGNIIASLKGNYDHHSAGQIAQKVKALAKAGVLPQGAL